MQEKETNLGECPVCGGLLITEEEMSAGICENCEMNEEDIDDDDKYEE